MLINESTQGCPATNVKTFGVPSVVPQHIRTSLQPYLDENHAALELQGYGMHSTCNEPGIFVKHSTGECKKEILFLSSPSVANPIAVADLGASFSSEDTLDTWIPTQQGALFTMDQGGSEFWQIYAWNGNAIKRLTEDSSRYTFLTYRAATNWLAYASPKKTGKKTDVYLRDLSKPWTDENECLLVDLPLSWKPLSWSPDGRQLLVARTTSASSQDVFLVSLESHLGDNQAAGLEPRQIQLPGVQRPNIMIQSAIFSKTNPSILYMITNAYSDFLALCQYDLSTEELIHLTTPEVSSSLCPIPWDISHMTAVPGGILFVANEDGSSTLHFIHVKTNEPCRISALPQGIVRSLKVNQDYTKASVQLDSTFTPSSLFEVDLQTFQVQPYTFGLNTSSKTRKVEPELVRFSAFDGLQIPAFLYQPPMIHSQGPRPVVIYVHGGPATQYKPGYQPVNHPLSFQYLANELQIAVLVPNIRGSTGYGMKYMEADDAMKRHDSIKDIGSCIRWIKANPELDPSRICIMGRSCKLLHFTKRINISLMKTEGTWFKRQ